MKPYMRGRPCWIDGGPEATDAEIAANWAILSAAKTAKLARGECPELTDDELDALLPPVECRRTRARLRARAQGRRFVTWEGSPT